jgi:uncharacterized protein YggE
MLMPSRTLAAALFLLCASVGSGTSALAAQTSAPQRTITMSGHGQVSGPPDLVTITTGVSTEADTAATALADNTARMKKVFAALGQMDVPRNKIQTVNFSVSPEYSNGQNSQERALTGYRVTNQVRVQLDDVNALGKALDALVRAGANQMNGIDFAMRDPAPLLNQARAKAIADARTRAETYAKAAGVQLGPIVSIREGGEAPRPMYRMMAMAAAPAPVPVAAGAENVDANVTVVWEIQ